MNKKYSLCILKPDAIDRDLESLIISDIKENGMDLFNRKIIKFTGDHIKQIYLESINKPHYNKIYDYFNNKNVIVYIIKGENCVDRLNALVGATDPTVADNKTLRKKYGIDILKNTIHSSNDNRVDHEIAFIYGEKILIELKNE